MADYHSLLMRAVANLPNAGTPATRGAIYGRAKKALLDQLRSLRPPLPESDIAREEKALDAAIAEIEGRYGSEVAAQSPAAPGAAAPTPTSPPAGKPGPAPAQSPKVAPPPAPTQSPAQRPSPAAASAPSASPTRSPSQAGSPTPSGPTQSAAVQAAGAQRPQPPTPGRTQPPASPPSQAPTAPAGKPAAVASTAAASPSPARSQLAAAMGSSPSGRAAPSVVAKGGKDEGLPGVTALDPARAVRPNRADNGHESGAPPVVVTRRDELVQAVDAPRSGGRDGPARPSLPARCGDPAPGRAGRRRRQAETMAMDRSGGSPWRRPCGGGSRDPDAPEAAGPRHQAARRGAAACPAAAVGEDRRARRTASAPISRASSSR